MTLIFTPQKKKTHSRAYGVTDEDAILLEE